MARQRSGAGQNVSRDPRRCVIDSSVEGNVAPVKLLSPDSFSQIFQRTMEEMEAQMTGDGGQFLAVAAVGRHPFRL